MIGAVIAMECEADILLRDMKIEREEICYGKKVYLGKAHGKDVVLTVCGVGKVNAALCAQILCSIYGVSHLVNTGIAGSLDAQLDICDLVVSEDAMYHDFTVTAFGYPYGKVPGMNVIAFPADPMLIKLAYAAAEAVNPGHTKVGRVASGDQFVCDKSVKDGIIANTQALCTEMEGAAIAHTAYRNGVPFVILRAISDKADGSAEMDYPAFETLAAHRCAEVTRNLARQLKAAE